MMKNSDSKGSRFGMWLFLYSEIMLFGSLFILYSAYYQKYRSGFISGGRELDLTLGVVNTAILLTSSCTVALSLSAIQRNSRRLAALFLASAIVLGFVFLGIKYHEWSHKILSGIYPGSALFKSAEQGRTIFYSLYFTMTGLHALHVLIGITILGTALVLVIREKISAEKNIFLENAGLYWHLVDVLWIFIFPLLYLII